MFAGLWVQQSGDARSDAAYVAGLPTLAERRRELARLALLHGAGHRWNVELALRSIRDGAGAGAAEGLAEGSREAVLGLVRR